MAFEGALVQEQGITFAIVVVKGYIFDNRIEASRIAAGFQPANPGQPITLMGQDSRGRATCFGRPDIVRILSNVSVRVIPWREYTIN